MAINIATSFKVGGTLSIDDRFVLTKAEMKAMSDNLIPEVYFCLCSEDGNLYLYNKNNDVDENLGKYRLFSGESSTIQKEVLPTASVDELNNIYQYIGTTTSDYINGYFYKCVLDTDNGIYKWENIEVQKSSGIEFNNWEAGKDYILGDYVVYNNNLYKANVNSNSSTFEESNFDLVIGNEVQTTKQTDDNYTYAITLGDDTTQDLLCDKITQINGEETVEIVIAKEDSSDGSVSNGDIISITKTIKGKEVYSYKYDEEIVDPFA